MFKDFIKGDVGEQLYPVLSMVMFVAFFVALTIRALMYKKRELDEMSGIPLDAQGKHINETINSKK